MAPLARSLHARARTASHHKLGEDAAVDSAQRAAISPPVEQAGADATATADRLNETGKKTEDLKRDDFRTQLRKAVDKEMYEAETEDQANKVMNEGAAHASATMRAGLAHERARAVGELPAAADPKSRDVHADVQPPPERVDLQVEAAGPQLARVDAKPAVPPPLPAEKLDCSSHSASTDQLMADNQVTTGQLQEGNDPAFGPALTARANAEKSDADLEPAYRKEEGKIRAAAEGRAEVAVQGGLAAMHRIRGADLLKVESQQHGVRAADADKRREITDRITGIKNKTKADVEAILADMDDKAGVAFDAGLKRASDAYEAGFKEERGGIGTWLTTWRPSSWRKLIARALASGKKAYLDEVNRAIDAVATIIDDHLHEAKARVGRGRSEVEEVVRNLKGDMRNFGEQAKSAVKDDFGAMESQIDGRRDALINRLSEQLKASYQKMNERAEELRKENESLWDRVYDATVGAVKKIIEFKNLLFSVLAKAASVVLDIIAHPIRFLGNLVDAVGQGLRNFKKNIGTHLQKGLMEWLFGALASAGLKLPDKFDLEGIISIILQIFGLTYDNFRARAVHLLGEPIVAALEKSAEVFMIFMREGFAGIWRFIKEQVGDLKPLVVDAIWGFIKEEVFMAGITWIIGLLNPASAFFKACKAIYDIIVFFVNRASQIVTFVNAVIDSVAAIVAGNLGAAIAAVEDALAKAIPLAIGLLASLLGLGDPSKPVKATIEKARSPINKAIDWVIHGAAKLVKTVAKVVTGKRPGQPAPAGVTDLAAARMAELLGPEATVDAAKAAAAQVARELQPQGLHRLFLKEGESGWLVEAEASPLRALFTLFPKGKHYSCRFAAKLWLSGAEAPTTGTRHRTGLSTFKQKVGRGRSGAAVDLSIAQLDRPAYEEAYTGFMLTMGGDEKLAKEFNEAPAGAEGLKPVAFITANTGDPKGRSNSSHAEEQFADWFLKQDKSWRDRVERMELFITLSPCGHRHQNCVSSLINVKNATKKECIATLSWDNPWVDPGGETTTTAEDVKELAKAYTLGKAPIHDEKAGTAEKLEVKRL